MLAALAVVTGLSVVLAPAASAHPLGNATVNHYDGLRLFPDHVAVRAIEDIAEIPTLQRAPDIDSNGDGVLSAAERAAYAARQCSALAAAERITAGGNRLPLSVLASDYSERPGAIQLKIGRLVCQLQAKIDLTHPATISIDDQWDSGGIGWHEITAVGGGVSIQNSVFPASSVSGELLRYPNNLLSSPLDVHSGSLQVQPGNAASTYRPTRALPSATLPLRALNSLANRFNALVGAKHLTVGVGLLAVLLSMLLGAGHAFLPGHGKTIMAAYLVGRSGRRRDIVTVGATVTLTHTAGVLVLGGLISITAAFAPTAAEQYLAVVSGLLVSAVGVGLLINAVGRQRRATSGLAGEVEGSLVALDVPNRILIGADGPPQPAPANPLPTPTHEHEHGHGHGLGHGHGHGHGHGDGHGDGGPPKFGRGGLIGLGVAGGLVPSPSALLVLLAAIALGRTVFGVVLVLGYGLGMAAALTAAGLILVRLRGRLGRVFDGRTATATRLINALPVVTACLVLVVGVGLTLRAIGGTI